MALRGALEHPKILALADALGIMDCFALGIMEAFWHHVGKYHEDGEVTGLNPRVLVRSIRYTGDAQELWDALINIGLIDMSDGRAIVHGWSERADDAIQAKLYRAIQRFADGTKPKARSVGKEEKERVEAKWNASDCPPFEPKTVPDNCRTSEICPQKVLPEPEPEPKENNNNPPTPRGGNVSILEAKPLQPPKIPKPPKFEPENAELPPNVPPAAWLDWVANWREKHKPLTARAVKLQLAFLGKMPDPAAVIEQSIRCGWTGLFELELHSNGSTPRGSGMGGIPLSEARRLMGREA